MKKSNIIILNCCHLGEAETGFWNSFWDAYKDKFNVIFFSTNHNKDLLLPHFIDLSYQMHVCNSGFDKTDSELVRLLSELAEYEKIWGNYDPSESPRASLSWYLFWTVAVKSLMPVAVYIWNGYRIPELTLSSIAKSSDIPVYYMERGPFAHTFACDPLGINFSSSFVQAYDTIANVNRKRILEFAELYLAGGDSNLSQPSHFNGKNEFLEKLGLPSDKLIFFFPSQLDHDTNSKLFSPHFSSVFDAYVNLIKALESYGNKVFLLAKKHPLMDSQEEAPFREISSLNVLWHADVHVFDCIRYCDAVISINSSCAVEASLFGKPILLLGGSILKNHKAVLSISQRSDIHHKVVDLISLAVTGEPILDFQFFDRLLFGFLYSAKPEFKALGIRSVEDIPVKVHQAKSDYQLYGNREVDAISLMLRHTAHMSEQIDRLTLSSRDIDKVRHYIPLIDKMANSGWWASTDPIRKILRSFVRRRNEGATQI